MQKSLIYKLQLFSDAVLDYLLYPENNCKPAENAYVYLFQVNYLRKMHLLDDTDKAHDFSRSLSCTVIFQNVSQFRKRAHQESFNKMFFLGK